jgi:hypothetical protein
MSKDKEKAVLERRKKFYERDDFPQDIVVMARVGAVATGIASAARELEFLLWTRTRLQSPISTRKLGTVRSPLSTTGR